MTMLKSLVSTARANEKTEDEHIKPLVQEEKGLLNSLSAIGKAILGNLEILTKTLKEDRAYRLKTLYNGYDFQKITTVAIGVAGTSFTTITFTEPVTSITCAVSTFNTATRVYFMFESTVSTDSMELTTVLPSMTVTGLPIKRITVASDNAGAIFQVTGLRGE